MKIIGKTLKSRPRWGLVLALAALLGWWTSSTVPTAAAPEQAAAPASSAGKPAKVRVAKGLFKAEVTLSGVFEAKRVAEVSIRPKSWTMPLVVDSAVALGKPVKKGDVLVELDHAKIDRAIRDAELENTVAEMALQHAVEELPILEKSTPVEMAAAERARRYADEDLKNFAEIERPLAERSAHYSVKRSSEWLEYAKEELRQLEKMYRSKDLTEETEEIILRRQRFQIEMYEFFLREAEIERDQTLKVHLPRQDQHVKDNAVKQAIELERARALLPLNLNQKRLTIAKLTYDRERGAAKLADLRSDRDAMTVHAPIDGLVYYGRPARGQWSSAATEAAKMHKGGIIQPDEVFLTVVEVRPLAIRAVIEEKDLAALSRPGELHGRVTPAFDKDLHLAGRLASILTVPTAAGKFEAIVDVELPDEKTIARPGMACSVKFTTYRKENALTVPSSAVFDNDMADEPSHYVYLAKAEKDGSYPQRRVKTGKTASGKTEIVEGLAEGDEILAAKPSQ